MESNPYLEARREWDERYADLVLGKRNWQIAADGLLLLSLIVASGIVWLGNHSRWIPYVVEIDKLGYALTCRNPLRRWPARRRRANGTLRSRRPLSATHALSPAIDKSSMRCSMRCSRIRGEQRTAFSTSNYHSDNFSHNRSRSPRSRPFPFRSIRSFSIRRAAIRCDGPSSSATLATAASACASGQPKNAITPSPRYFATRPPKRVIAAAAVR